MYALYLMWEINRTKKLFFLTVLASVSSNETYLEKSLEDNKMGGTEGENRK